MCFVFIWEQTATCATYSINWLVFVTEMKSVYSAVRTGSLNKAVCASSLKGQQSVYIYPWKLRFCCYFQLSPSSIACFWNIYTKTLHVCKWLSYAFWMSLTTNSCYFPNKLNQLGTAMCSLCVKMSIFMNVKCESTFSWTVVTSQNLISRVERKVCCSTDCLRSSYKALSPWPCGNFSYTCALSAV